MVTSNAPTAQANVVHTVRFTDQEWKTFLLSLMSVLRIIEGCQWGSTEDGVYCASIIEIVMGRIARRK
jgi:hypothetical protein